MKKKKSLLSAAENDFLLSLKRILPVSVLLFIYFIYTTCLVSFGKSGGIPVFLHDYSEDFSAIISTSAFANTTPFAMLLAGFICGYIHFNFLGNERLAFSLLSFSEKRGIIIKNRAAAFLLEVTLSTVIPLFVCFAINLTQLKPGKEMYLTFIAFLLSQLVIALWGYLCTGFALSLSVSKIRALVFSCAFAAFPSMLSLLSEILCERFVYGWGEGYFIDEFKPVFLLISPDLEIVGAFFDAFLSYERILGVVNKGEFNEEYTVTSICSAVIWLFIIFIIYLLCKKYFEKRYKPERINGKNYSVIGVAATGMLVFMCTEYVYFIMDSNNHSLPLLSVCVGIFAFLLSSLLTDIKNFRPKKYCRCVASLCVLVMALAIPVVTGGFGFEKRIPDFDEIKEIAISSPVDYALSGEIYSFEGSHIITDEKDIKTVLELHKKLTDNKSFDENTLFCVKYTLNNGKTLVRSYETTNKEISRELLKIFETNAYKSYLFDLLCPGFNKTYIGYDGYEVEELTRDDYMMSLISKDGCVKDFSDDEITKEQFDELKKALYYDLTSLSANDYFNPYGEEIGVIRFVPKDEIADKLNRDYGFYSSESFYINENMKNTLSVLKKYGLYKYFTCNYEITGIKLYNIQSLSTIYGSIFTEKTLVSSEVGFWAYDYIRISTAFKGFYTKPEIKTVFDRCRSHGFIDDGDKLALAKLKDGAEVYFIYKEGATQ